MKREIALGGLSERVDSAMRVHAARLSLTIETADEARRCVALVMAAPRTAAARAEAARLTDLHPDVPLVLLSRRRQSPATVGRVHALVAAATDSTTTAIRLLRAAAEASDDYRLRLVGGSPAMRALRAELHLSASVPSNILLLGETGTGKGVAARALHELSERTSEPFETVDCTGLAPNLIESELFGHERGAFTGAFERHIGRLERAGRGTLFLDEIGELEVGLQTRLLRALEDRVFERVGGNTLLPLGARIVAATHRDLWTDVAAGRFRRDLLYRLDVLRIQLPALAERSSDIGALTHHLVSRAAERLGRPRPRASPEFIAQLEQRPWPGNIRELANVLEATVVRSGSNELRIDSLTPRPPFEIARERPPNECEELSALLVECGGNVARVARRLGRPRSTVRSRISKLGLSRLLERN